MDHFEQPGTIPISALNGRASSSKDAARLRQIQADLRLSPKERVIKALQLGINERQRRAQAAK